jgi:signal transduction histidine kinase
MLARIDIPGVQLEGELGRGASSVVYRARRGGLLCAVKIPRVRGRWTRWVYREAVSLARVKHPGLPAVWDVGEVDRLPYLIMELVEGETLATLLTRGPLTETETVAIGLQLADILRAVHAVGLVHRDVKPGNIVVTDAGTVRLVDFGFATSMERRATARDVAGTPRYVAPEQLRTPARIDGRADLYALGRVLCEAVTGWLPRGTSTADSTLVAMLLEAGVSSGMAQVLGALLAAAPDERYPHATALLRELEALRALRCPRGVSAYKKRHSDTPPVAREHQLERLTRAWSQATSTGHAAIIEGGRGSGKTRLLTTFAARAEKAEVGRVVEISAHQGDAPLTGLRCIFESLAGERIENALRAAAGDDLASLVLLIAPKLGKILGPNVKDTEVPTSVPESAAEFLVRVAKAAGPLLICADDFQWMDPVSRDALVWAGHRAREAPMVLAVATRERTPAVERIASLHEKQLISIQLGAMDDAAVAALVASHLGDSAPDDRLVRRVAMLAEGTPLGVLDVVGAYLDGGALRPQSGAWTFDMERADRIVLPDGARALLWRRIDDLPPAARRVLSVAAVLGSRFDETLVARVIGLPASDIGYALAHAYRGQLLEFASGAEHRFVHDSLREMLLQAIDSAELRKLNQRVAEILEEGGEGSIESLCASARHYEAGELDKAPKRAYRVARDAGKAALERFDNETALHFLEFAAKTAEAASIPLGSEFYRDLGEVHLRLGTLDQGLSAFHAALERATDRETRAALGGRIAWVLQASANPEEAWRALEGAFAELDARLPSESAASVPALLRSLATNNVGMVIRRSSRSEATRTKQELLSELHYQNARMGMEYGKPARVLQSALAALAYSAALGPSSVRARALASYGCMAGLVAKKAGAAALRDAQSMASRLGDQATVAFCIQMRSMAATLSGDLEQALSLLRECVEIYGPWLELHEFCYDVTTAEIIESVRGRSREAWNWISRAVQRLGAGRGQTAVHLEYVVHRARTAAAAMGRAPEEDPWLTAQLRSTDSRPEPQGFHRVLSWGPRARYCLERDELGATFDALVDEFEADGHNVRAAHPSLVEYYVAVAHGRVEQCLRTPPVDRISRLPALRKALSDLRATAKLALVKTHLLLIEGYLAWFEASPKKAKKSFADAETAAERERCPWVLYGVARARAHMLREDGKLEEARVHARMAELHASEHGATRRAQWVRDEFSLSSPAAEGATSTKSESRSAERAQRHLGALLEIVRSARPEMQPREQATAILTDLLRELHADRGAIWFRHDAGLATTLKVNTDRNGEIADGDGWQTELLQHALSTGEPWQGETGERLVVLPLFLFGKSAGAFALERCTADPPFTSEERELIAVLCQHLPMALEMARLLAEREQMEASLRQAQKMEAAGQLAGGVAHDFNNMLTAIQSSLNFMRERDGLDPELVPELEIMSKATKQAAALSSQLLAFSRSQEVELAALDVNAMVKQLEPILRRLLGDGPKVSLALDPDARVVKADHASLDQAIVNLTLNARDAMVAKAEGGLLTISTKNVVLGEDEVRRGAPRAGEYVVIEVADTGLGMNEETLARVFEPFFTTKPVGRGTGLGLAMVYTSMKNCGGYVDVSSVLGQGTTFRLHVPVANELPALPVPPQLVYEPRSVSSLPKKPSPKITRRPDATPKDQTILVVDDDSLLGESIKRILQRDGYRVLMAGRADDAMDIARQRGAEISLVILDVLMPEVSGPELGRRLGKLQIPPKLLFVSGFAPESLPPDAGNVREEAFLQKPFSGNDLLGRVRHLLDTAS